MELSRTEELKNRTIAGVISISIFTLLLLFLILYNLITPNPPFPDNGGGSGTEMALGMIDAGSGDIEYGSIGKVTDVVAEETPSKTEEIIEDPTSDVEIKTDKKDEAKPELKNDVVVIKPVKEKPKVLTEAEKLAEKFKKLNGKNGEGIGNNPNAGQNGAPDGDPFKNGNGGSGGGKDKGNGTGQGDHDGPGKGPGFGTGKFGIDLKGRAVINPPKLPSDINEEGKVVVDIIVDTQGNVIEANPNGRGTTTSSALLKSKAKQAAMAVKFNVDGKFEEQKGTITFIFSFE
jgi:outer membrane biosynthesis protein TonB